jgi:hypothetical protein
LKHLPLLALTLAAFCLRLLWLWQTPEPTGTDGSYYGVQIADWSAGKGLHVPDSSWVLRFFGALGWVMDPIAAHKVGGALLAALCVPAGWWAGERIRPGGGMVVALLAACSPSLTHLAGDFAKNLGMMAPLLLWLGGLLAPAKTWKGWVLPILGAILAAWSHRLGAALVVLSLGGAVLARLDKRLILGGAAAVLGFAALSQALPGLLHLQDLDRLKGAFDLSLHFPQPWPLAELRDTNPVQLAEWSLAWAGLFAVAVMGRRAWPLLPPLAVVLLLPWDLNVLDMGYRLALISPVLVWPLAGKIGKSSLWGVLLLPLATLGFAPKEHPPYSQYRRQIERIPEQPKLLIAHQGFNFLYDYETGQEAMAWAPEAELNREEVGRIAVGFEPDDFPDPRSVTALDPNTVYVNEATWERLLEQADPLLRARMLTPQNPSRVRPESMRRGR